MGEVGRGARESERETWGVGEMCLCTCKLGSIPSFFYFVFYLLEVLAKQQTIILRKYLNVYMLFSNGFSL